MGWNVGRFCLHSHPTGKYLYLVLASDQHHHIPHFLKVLIVDFAHGVAENWVSAYEENESRWCFAGLIVFSIGCYVLSLVGIVLMYIFYTTVLIPIWLISGNEIFVPRAALVYSQNSSFPST